ncbi:hypothetical protein ACFLTM_04030 [Candidatus Bipolaricaulota bacterium]
MWVFSEEIETYEEWCNRLDELHRQREAMTDLSVYEPIFIGAAVAAALTIGLFFLPYSHWIWSLPVDVIIGIAVGLPATIGIFITLRRILDIAPSPLSIPADIYLLTKAGANRMWFYPCE